MLFIALLCVPVIVIFVAIAVDVARLIEARSDAQRALDMAALSGAGGIPFMRFNADRSKIDTLSQLFNGAAGAQGTNNINSLDPNVQATDLEFYGLDLNGEIVDLSGPSLPAGEVASGNENQVQVVKISKQYSIDTTLTSIIGHDIMNTTVESFAAATGPRCFNVNIPMVLMDCDTGVNQNCGPTQCGQSYSQVLFNPDQTDNAAWFQPTDPANANDCKDAVENSTSWTLCVGDTAYLNNGTMTSCLMKVEDQCFGRRPGECTVANPWYVTVPVIDCEYFGEAGNPFNQETPITGFARVGITDVQANPGHTIDFVLDCEVSPVPNPQGSGGQLCGLFSAPTLIQ